MFVFTVILGGTHLVFAHDSAVDARDKGTMQAMEDFLLHTKKHWEQLSNPDDHANFRAALRTDDGVWKDGDIYVVLVNQRSISLEAGESVVFHAGHPIAAEGSLRHIPIFEQLVNGTGEEPFCLEDDRTDGRHICAVNITINQAGVQYDFILVVGFDHKEYEVDFSRSQCPEFEDGYFGQTATDPNGEPFTRTSAHMVTNRESLKDYPGRA